MTEIYACATHGVLSDPAVDRIANSALREVVITDTVPLPAVKQIAKIKVLSVAPLIGEAIKRIHRGESVGALFSSEVSFTQEMLLWEDGSAAAGAKARARPAPTADTRGRRRTITDARTGRRLTGPPTRRSMSLQLHRPDGKGGLEPRPVTDQNWREPAPLPALGRVAQGRQAARARRTPR